MSDIKIFQDLQNNVMDRLINALSLLAKAFHGELVGQDMGDESAEVLVERVRKGRKD